MLYEVITNIVAWRQLAEIAEKWIHKGATLYVEGKIRTRSYDDSAGQKRYITEIFADTIQFVGRKADGSGQAEPVAADRVSSPQPAASAPRVVPPSPQSDPFAPTGDNDDLPF